MTLRIWLQKRERRQRDRGAGVGAGVPISDHVQHGAKLGRLVKNTRCVAICCVQEGGCAVQEHAVSGMVGHVMQR